MLEWIIFVVGTVALVYAFRATLRHPRAHGFYRFFAWEAILALLLLNVEYWFQEPFSLRQLGSWLLLALSAGLAVYGAYTLRALGKADTGRRDDTSLYAFEKTTELVTGGAYRYIRHPLYGSALVGTWGIYLKNPSWPAVLLTVVTSACWVITAKIEETECIRYFGADYQAYMKRTRMFVPFVI